ncbi:vif protein [Simian immunodeficiency virus - agm]|uniref:Virion infectivity factor n=1 Tax=Simian immunodeficiency virus - agm TaxID=11726 RepID=A0A1B4WRJ9_SIV|nr:vif protein [Simian immunodeficiency virus - agm]
MDREKEWVMRITWRVDSEHISRWQGIVRYWMEKRGIQWEYKMHYKIHWAWYTMCQYIIPLETGDIYVDMFWHLTPQTGWLSTYAVGIQYLSYQGNYRTELDPGTADSMIHLHYFNCFTERAIQKAIRGERFVFCNYPEGHKQTGQVQTLQFLALQAVQDGFRRKRKQGKEARVARNLGFKQRTLGRVAKRYAHRSQPRSEKTFWERAPVPSMELLSRGRGEE